MISTLINMHGLFNFVQVEYIQQGLLDHSPLKVGFPTVESCPPIWNVVICGIDGDHPTKDPKGVEKVKEAHEATKGIKRIQIMVRNLLFQAQDILPNSPGEYPVFVHLLTQVSLGMIDCNLPYPQV